MTLFPGSRGSDLRGIVYHALLNDPGNNRALSYTWGTDTGNDTMWTPGGILQLTPSLHAALNCVRHPKEPMVLWVDALCINQDSNEEKEKQIRLLPHIFQRSTCVIAFLGSDDDSNAALVALMQIQAGVTFKDRPKEWPESLAKIPKSWEERPVPP